MTDLRNSEKSKLNIYIYIYTHIKAMPKNAQTTAQLHSSHTLVK